MALLASTRATPMPQAALPWLAFALAIIVLGGCGRSEVPETPTPPVQPPTAAPEPAADSPQDIEDVIDDRTGVGSYNFEAYAYDCGGREIVVRPGDHELMLVMPDRSILLPQVEAASGAKYAEGDDGFWGKGIDSAVLTLDGEDTPCRLDRRETPWADARARGAVFRGLGQEPGWHLEVHPERIVMVYQYGEQRAVVPNPGVVAEPDRPVRRWQATTEAHELLLQVEDRGCTDVMSGDIHPATVVVTLDGRTYTGCGRDLD